MLKNLDNNLIAELEADPVVSKITRGLNKENRIFLSAWVNYKTEKWFPVLVEERGTSVIGFDFNPSGKWGKNTVVEREKIPLVTFLALYISNTYSNKSSVRCRTRRTPSKDARNFGDLTFTSELGSLINDYRERFAITSEVSGNSTQTNSQLGIRGFERPFSDTEIGVVKIEAKEIEIGLEGFNGEDREAISRLRVNQGKFRELLLRYWGTSCAVCGLGEKKLLVASHILPWSKSNAKQKGDPFNGLLLAVNWDALFDKGLISFDTNGRAILDRLSSEVIERLGLGAEKQVLNVQKLREEHKQYLLMHRILHDFE